METFSKHPWQVLLIGESSGVGKTVIAQKLAGYFSVSLLLADDIRMALQQATTPNTNPDLHIFLNYTAEQWQTPESIHCDWIRVGQAMIKPLSAIVNHHIFVRDVGPVIIEGDGILPLENNPIFRQRDVSAVFIVEQDEVQLLRNLHARGRGFDEGGELEQKSFARASWLYGQWIAREAGKLGLPVIQARPQETLLDRLLSAIGSGQAE